MKKVKVGLDGASANQVADKGDLVSDRMGENATIYTNPIPSVVDLKGATNALRAEQLSHEALLAQLQASTVQVRTRAEAVKELLIELAAYVEKVADGDEEKILLSGFEVAGSTKAPVGPMPKVEGLSATQGEAEGEIDLQWTPVRRGLRIYEIESAPEASGPWTYLEGATKSSITLTGLTSGKRYWFRVKATGTSGSGAPSESVTRMAP